MLLRADDVSLTTVPYYRADEDKFENFTRDAGNQHRSIVICLIYRSPFLNSGLTFSTQTVSLRYPERSDTGPGIFQQSSSEKCLANK